MTGQKYRFFGYKDVLESGNYQNVTHNRCYDFSSDMVLIELHNLGNSEKTKLELLAYINRHNATKDYIKGGELLYDLCNRSWIMDYYLHNMEAEELPASLEDYFSQLCHFYGDQYYRYYDKYLDMGKEAVDFFFKFID